MAFILSLLISTLLFITVDANPVGKYFGVPRSGSALLFYIKEDNTVYVVYDCRAPRNSRAGPYLLGPGPGANEYIIEDNSSPGSRLRDLMRDHCQLDVDDSLTLRFAPDEDSLTASLGNEAVGFQRFDNSYLIPYYSTYKDLDIDWYLYNYQTTIAEVTVKCGASEVTANFLYVPDWYDSPYVIGPDQTESYDGFKYELSNLCGVELSPNDFKTMTFATSERAYTELGGQRLTLTAV